MGTRLKYFLIGVVLASAVVVWAGATNLGRLVLDETPEITGSNSETISNATDGQWRFNAPLIASSDDANDLGTTALQWQDVYSSGTFYVDTKPILKTLSWSADSLGATDYTFPAVLTLESDITVLRMEVTCRDAMAGNAGLAIFHSGTTADTVSVASGAKTGSNVTDYNFAAAAVCSLTISDGSAGTGGLFPLITLQYTDKRD